MSAARARKILLAALAISLLVHLLLAGYIRWPIFGQSREEPVAKVRILRIARRTPPPPTPAPTPVPTPAATPAVHASIAPPPVTPRGNKGLPRVQTIPVPARTPSVRATVAPTPIITPTATPLGACGGHENADPTVAATPDAAVDITPQARASKISGTAAVHVLLDPQGHVTDASIAQSTGNAGLDATAMQMARSATYTPRYVDCKAVAGDYTFTVKFVAW